MMIPIEDDDTIYYSTLNAAVRVKKKDGTFFVFLNWKVMDDFARTYVTYDGFDTPSMFKISKEDLALLVVTNGKYIPKPRSMS